MAALLGLGGPGGYVAMVGGAAEGWEAFAVEAEGVHVLAVNPPPGVRRGRGSAWPRPAAFRSRAVTCAGWCWAPVRLRLGLGGGGGPLPAAGTRVVGEGEIPSMPELEVLASADGVWVARLRRV